MMNQIQPSDVELRLLRVLDVLLETHSVTRAAAMLGVTPSAVSHSLRELRRRTSDPLLVRSGSKLKPTPRAEAMRPLLRDALTGLHHLLVHPQEFDPRTTSRRFSIGAADHLLTGPLTNLVPRILAEAPQARFEFRPVTEPIAELLESGELDLALTMLYAEDALGYESVLMRRRVVSERFVCIARPGHPALLDGRIDIAAFTELPQVLINVAGARSGVADEALRAIGLKRKIALVVTSANTAVQYVASSDLLAIVPLSVATRAKAQGLLSFAESPIKLPLASGLLWWHRRFHHEPAHAWWRERICQALDASPSMARHVGRRRS